MKGWIWVLLILGVWIAYKRDSTFAAAVNRLVPVSGSNGLQSPLSAGYGNSVSGASRSGSTSPGSGVPATQPNLTSTWGVGNSGAGAGFTGVAWGGPVRSLGDDQ